MDGNSQLKRNPTLQEAFDSSIFAPVACSGCEIAPVHGVLQGESSLHRPDISRGGSERYPNREGKGGIRLVSKVNGQHGYSEHQELT